MAKKWLNFGPSSTYQNKKCLARHHQMVVLTVNEIAGRIVLYVYIYVDVLSSVGRIGFLSEHRRLNVAITRARRHLVVVCDSNTLSHDKTLKSLVKYMTNNGERRTASTHIKGLFKCR